MLKATISSFHTEVGVWFEDRDAPASITFIVEAQQLSTVTLNEMLKGDDTRKGVIMQPDGQITPRFLVADLTVVVGKILCKLKTGGGSRASL